MYIFNKMRNKYWEIEFFAFNFQKKEMELICVLDFYIKAKTFQEAFFKLKRMKNPYWRLSGRWFKSINKSDENQKTQKTENVIKDMTFDEFFSWLDLHTEKEIRFILKTLKEKKGFENKIKMTEAYLENKSENDKG